MPPKRANKRAAPTSPARQAPSRTAKTRSAASTASMYKVAAEYHDIGSTEEDDDDDQDDRNLVHESFSDQISEPEDVILNTSEEDMGTMEVDSDDDIFEAKVTTRARSGTKKGSNSSKASVSTRSGQKRTAASGKDSTPPGKKSSPRASRAGGSKPGQALQPISKSTVVAPKASSATAGVKRKASNLKFALGSTTPASLTSPATSASATSRRAGPSASVSKTGKNNTASRGHSNVLEDEPWEEKYAPASIDEVAVHKGKVKDVREWLEKHTAAGNRLEATGGAILVLTGPAGTGKTTVLRMLAKELDLHIVEWINSVNENNIIQRPPPPGQDTWRSSSIDEEYIPVMRAFEEFFARAHRFQPLQLAGNDPTVTASSSSFASTSGATRKKNIILIEDLPPVSAYSSRKIFQDTISKFASIGGSRASAVLVIIISDVFSKQNTELLFSSSNESRDPALTIRTLLPTNLLNRIDSGGRNAPNVMQIKFNPIAITFQRKALKSLIDQEFRGPTLAYAPDMAEINQIIEIHDGDIRASINALQFLCLLKAKDRKKYRDAALKLELENAELGAAGGGNSIENILTLGQDSSLGIFHAVARVLYNRRNWNEPPEVFDADIVKVPKESRSKERPPLRFNPEKDLIEKLPIEPDLYALMLHQNYSRHLKTIDECSTAMEYLCLADQFASQTSYTQAAQMQPYMSSVAVRGLLFAPRTTGPANASGIGGGAKKHWWPELFAVNRAMRSNDQMFHEVASDLSGQEAHGLAAGHIYGPGFLPKAVIRQEIVPMLHRCVSMNPYMPIMNQVLRPSSKNFVRNQAGGYGLKIGMGQKKEFGEGDEGFMEEVAGTPPSSADSVFIFDSGGTPLGPSGVGQNSTNSTPQSTFRSNRQPQQQHSYSSSSILPVDDDPIEDFSD